MKKSSPKIILNLSVENSELEEKVKIAIDEYIEDVALKNLDDTIIKLVNKRIDKLVSGPSRYWERESTIDGVSLQEYVCKRTEQVLKDTIDKRAKEILAKKLAELI